MRIEVSVLGIRKDRGKLPAPTTLGPLTLASSPAAGPILDRPLDAALEALVIGAEIREPLATAHPVSAKATKRRIRITTMFEHYPL
jgi:hypothetical protein